MNLKTNTKLKGRIKGTLSSLFRFWRRVLAQNGPQHYNWRCLSCHCCTSTYSPLSYLKSIEGPLHILLADSRVLQISLITHSVSSVGLNQHHCRYMREQYTVCQTIRPCFTWGFSCNLIWLNIIKQYCMKTSIKWLPTVIPSFLQAVLFLKDGGNNLLQPKQLMFSSGMDSKGGGGLWHLL